LDIQRLSGGLRAFQTPGGWLADRWPAAGGHGGSFVVGNLYRLDHCRFPQKSLSPYFCCAVAISFLAPAKRSFIRHPINSFAVDSIGGAGNRQWFDFSPASAWEQALRHSDHPVMVRYGLALVLLDKRHHRLIAGRPVFRGADTPKTTRTFPSRN